MRRTIMITLMQVVQLQHLLTVILVVVKCVLVHHLGFMICAWLISMVYGILQTACIRLHDPLTFSLFTSREL